MSEAQARRKHLKEGVGISKARFGVVYIMHNYVSKIFVKVVNSVVYDDCEKNFGGAVGGYRKFVNEANR